MSDYGYIIAEVFPDEQIGDPSRPGFFEQAIYDSALEGSSEDSLNGSLRAVRNNGSYRKRKKCVLSKILFHPMMSKGLLAHLLSQKDCCLPDTKFIIAFNQKESKKRHDLDGYEPMTQAGDESAMGHSGNYLSQNFEPWPNGLANSGNRKHALYLCNDSNYYGSIICIIFQQLSDVESVAEYFAVGTILCLIIVKVLPMVRRGYSVKRHSRSRFDGTVKRTPERLPVSARPKSGTI